MKLKKVVFNLLAVVLLLGVLIPTVVPPVMAYFTTYTRAKGGYTIHLTGVTTIDEEFQNWEKTVTITNKEGKDVFVRARGYAGSQFTLTYSGEGWSDGGDGWWYYGPALSAGKTANPLVIAISNLPEAEEGDSFNVAVVYESTLVQYNADGTTKADWEMILDPGGEQG